MMLRTATWIGIVCTVAMASWLWLPSRPESGTTRKPVRETRSDVPAPRPPEPELTRQASQVNHVNQVSQPVPLGRALHAGAQSPEIVPEEATIDIPADPPPALQGDERSRSGLPPALFDKRAELQSRGPTSERLAAIATRARHAPTEAALEQVRTSFKKRDEEAALAIGRFRMGTISEAEALALVARAEDDYRRETMSTLEISPREYASIFEQD